MGWDEALFGWAYARARAWSSPKVPAHVVARRASLEPSRERLRVIACALAGRSIDVREAEAEGGFAGDTLLLPKTMQLAPTIEANEDAYVVRVAWSIAALGSGLALRRAPEEPLERLLATVLAAPATRRALLERCPSAHERLEALERAALSEPRVRPTTSAARALEALLRIGLGESEGSDALSDAERAWVTRARAHAPHDAASLADTLGALLPPLRDLGWSARAPLPAPPAPWGWIGTRPTPGTMAIEAAAHDAAALPSGTELRARPRENVRRVSLPEDALEDNPLVHSFEKVHTAEEHRGGSKNTDGSDQLEDHAQALDELDLREVVRSTERTSSLMRCDAMIDGAAGDLMDEGMPSTAGIPYDEWNEKERAYRPDWCHVRVGTLQQRVAPGEASAFVAALRARGARHVDAVRAELERIEHERRWRSRQLDGSEIDDDAIVDRLGMVAAGHPGTDRVYRSRRRGAPGLAVLLLIDGSLSTDSWIADQRVLDVELESAHVIAEALEGLSVDLAIAAFHSHTRRDCRFLVVKDIDEPWAQVRSRVASLQPTGYTRIGPALRHATRVLGRSEARRRLLLVITDGKPNDYDRYEGGYGVADVRQAVREASRDGVHVHALAIDRSARFHLPKMFGAGGHSVVAHPSELALALGKVCADMAR